VEKAFACIINSFLSLQTKYLKPHKTNNCSNQVHLKFEASTLIKFHSIPNFMKWKNIHGHQTLRIHAVPVVHIHC